MAATFTFRSSVNEDRYKSLTDMLAHTLHYLNDMALFNEFCSKRAAVSVRLAISARRAVKDVVTYDNYMIMDNSQLTIHN